jgi:hypothetical protein
LWIGGICDNFHDFFNGQNSNTHFISFNPQQNVARSETHAEYKLYFQKFLPGRGKKYGIMERVLPLFILPFLIQSAVVPFIVTSEKLFAESFGTREARKIEPWYELSFQNVYWVVSKTLRKSLFNVFEPVFCFHLYLGLKKIKTWKLNI